VNSRCHLGPTLFLFIVIILVNLLELGKGGQRLDGVDDAFDPCGNLHEQRRHGEERHRVHQRRLREHHDHAGQGPQVPLQLVQGRVHVRHGVVQCPGGRRKRGDGARRLPQHPRAPRADPGARVAEDELGVLGRLRLDTRAAAQGLHAVRARAHGVADLGVLGVGVAEAEAAVRGLPPRQVGLRVLGRLGVEHALVPLHLGVRGSGGGEVALHAGLDGVCELVHVARGEAVELLAGPDGGDEHAHGEAQEDTDGDGGEPLLRQRRQLVHAVPRNGHQAVGQDEDGRAVVEPRLYRRDEPRKGGCRSCMCVVLVVS
jgi:hypothetical protein